MFRQSSGRHVYFHILECFADRWFFSLFIRIYNSYHLKRNDNSKYMLNTY